MGLEKASVLVLYFNYFVIIDFTISAYLQDIRISFSGLAEI